MTRAAPPDTLLTPRDAADWPKYSGGAYRGCGE